MTNRTRLGVRRFEVAERSMTPALEPGDYLVAVRWLPVREGAVVAFEHPERTGFWLVKRVTAVDETRAEVTSDNAEATRADSRSFGPLAVSEMYRVVLRYWPPGRITLRP